MPKFNVTFVVGHQYEVVLEAPNKELLQHHVLEYGTEYEKPEKRAPGFPHVGIVHIVERDD